MSEQDHQKTEEDQQNNIDQKGENYAATRNQR